MCRYLTSVTAWLCALISCLLVSAGSAILDDDSSDASAVWLKSAPIGLTYLEQKVESVQTAAAGMLAATESQGTPDTEYIVKPDNRAGDDRKPDETRTDRGAIRLGLPAFLVTAEVTGCVHFFSGQIDLLGRTLPQNSHRFLCYERIRLNLTCSRDVSRIEYTFLGYQWVINGSPGKTAYEVSLIIPKRPSTLDWSDRRLAPPLQLIVTAWDRSVPANKNTVAISDIELTGSVFDITYVQPRP